MRSKNIVKKNDIYNNRGDGIKIRDNAGSYFDYLPEITHNNIYFNHGKELNVQHESGGIIDAQYNFWGVTDSLSIAEEITDYYDNISSARADFSNWLNGKVASEPIQRFSAKTLKGGQIKLSWKKHYKASDYLLYSNNGAGEVDTNLVYKSLDSSYTQYIDTLPAGQYKFKIRIRDYQGQLGPFSYCTGLSDDKSPDFVSAYSVKGMDSIVVAFDERLDPYLALDTNNWTINNDHAIESIFLYDYDLFIGENDDNASLNFYLNKGVDTAIYVLQTEDYLKNLDQEITNPAWGDLDDDGDQDLIVGRTDGKISFYENTGSASQPDFKLVTHFYKSIDVGDDSSPVLGDLDGDNDLDLIIGENLSDSIIFYKNTGNSENPDFKRETSFFLNHLCVDGCRYINPVLCDYDHDNDLDLFIGSTKVNGSISLYRNDGGQANTKFAFIKTIVKNINPQANSGNIMEYWAAPALVDLDEDGDYDLFAGKYNGQINYYENIGSYHNPQYKLRSTNWQSIDVGNCAAPRFIDIDGDGGKSGGNQLIVKLGQPISSEYEKITFAFDSIVDMFGNASNKQTISFFPDDGNNNPEIHIEEFFGEMNDSVYIPYTISDAEYDTVNIIAKYSVDSGATWHIASIEGDTTGLDSSQYNDSLLWLSARDLPGKKRKNVRFKLTPYDDPHSTGKPYISNIFTLNNQLLRSIVPNNELVTSDSLQLINIKCLLTGINKNSLHFKLNKTIYSLDDSPLNLNGDTLQFDPSVENHVLPEDSIIVSLWANDVGGNGVDTCMSKFYTDFTAPHILSLNPMDGSFTEDKQPDIEVKMVDLVGHLNASTISLRVMDSIYTLRDEELTWHENDSLLTFSSSLAGITFRDQEIVRLSIYAEDQIDYGLPHTLKGMGEWTFIVNPGAELAKVAYPAENSYTSNNNQVIEAAIFDTLGIDSSSIALKVNNQSFDMASPATRYNGYQFTFHPERIEFSYPEGSNKIKITAKDIYGQPLKDTLAWNFKLDLTSPEVLEYSPLIDASVATLQPMITLKIKDSIGAIDTNSLALQINDNIYHLDDPGISWLNTDSLLTFRSDKQGITFEDGQVIDVAVQANDKIDYGQPNSLKGITRWNFYINMGGPETQLIYPQNNTVTANDKQNIVVQLKDPNNVDTNSILLNINNIDYSVDHPSMKYYEDTLFFIPGESHYSFREGIIDATLISSDSLAIPQDTLKWQFSVDLSPPYVADFFPAADTSLSMVQPVISIKILDSIGSVDMNSVAIKINDTTYGIDEPGLTWDFDKDIVRFSTEDQNIRFSNQDQVLVKLFAKDQVHYGDPHLLDENFHWNFNINLTGKLTHIVNDANNAGIEKANVEISDDNRFIDQQTTNDKGTTSSILDIGNYKTDANKAGYNNVSSTVKVKHNQETVVDVSLGSLGDYNADGLINYDDLDLLAIAWKNQITSVEMAPTIGLVPNLTVKPDRKINFEDLMVFAQMWNQSNNDRMPGYKSSPIAGKGKADIVWDVNLLDDNNLDFSINAKHIDDFRSSRLHITYDPEYIKPNTITPGVIFDNNGIMLSRNDEDSGILEIYWVYLNKLEKLNESVSLAKIGFDKYSEHFTIGYHYEIREYTSNPSGGKGRIDQKFIEQDKENFRIYPIPANDKVHFEFSVMHKAPVKLEIYNLQGQKVKTLINRHMVKGHYNLTWNLHDQKPGIYHCRFKAGDLIYNNQMIIVHH